jgi:flagellar protein FliJ
MAKFIFKLQPLLNIKEQMEEQLKNELGKAIQKLEAEKQVYRKLEEQREECIFNAGSEASQGVRVDKLKDYSSYITFLKKKMEKQKENINLVQKNVDNYREQLIRVVQEKEMLEKLKEKKYREFLDEQQELEQKLIDEVVNYKYNKQVTGDTNGEG